MSDSIETAPGDLTLNQAARLLAERPPLVLRGNWRDGDEPVYGVNTGFGLLARENIAQDKVRDLQRRLVRSHAAGVGPALVDDAVHLILALKANALAQGYSGVRPVVVGYLRITACFHAALVAGALSVNAAKGSTAPFDARVQELRRHAGQVAVAACLCQLLAGSEIRQSHVHCDRVQDPYSIRCQPQVMGACLEQLKHVAAALEREANAVTDNPLVFASTGEVISGGNFHAEPVALAADVLALVAAEIGNLSGQRTALLVNPAISGLLPFLVEEAGLNSGFMLAQVTAAALTRENRGLTHPASADIGRPGGPRVHGDPRGAAPAAMADNLAGIVAIELLAAAQGLDLHAPMTTSPQLRVHHDAIRARASFYDRDRPFAPDIEAVKAAILDCAFHLGEISAL